MKNCRSWAFNSGIFLSAALGIMQMLAPPLVNAEPAISLVDTARLDQSKDNLPSWRDNAAKKRICDFVRDITNPGSKNFVDIADRFATFDNDGTILCEKPAFFEVIYTRDRARAVQDKHPEWAANADIQVFLKSSDEQLGGIHTSQTMQMLAESADNMTEESMADAAIQWLDTAKHQRYDVLYKKLHYQPMIELIDYLRANQFQVYLCSGGQAGFMRCYSASEYAIVPAQVIGSSLVLNDSDTGQRSEIFASPKIQLFNVGANKPITIAQHIGKRPVIACGNSDGDLQMLTYAQDRKGPSLSILIHHDDEKREYKYDLGAEKVLPVAAQKGWLVVSMKDDFARVFQFDQPAAQ